MGGFLSLRALVEGRIDPAALVLVAPMLALRSPVGDRLGGLLARWQVGRGDPARAAWRRLEGERAARARQMRLTHDLTRFEAQQAWRAAHPDLCLGSPSWQWVAQAFAQTAALRADPRLDQLRTPVQFVLADADRLVDSRAAVRVAKPDARRRAAALRAGIGARDPARIATGARQGPCGDRRLPRFARTMTYDIAIVGAGIAGASLAAARGDRARVLLLEAEDMPGRHATGRSAAFWSETYGGPLIQPLTSASHDALSPWLQPLGSLHIGRAEDAPAIDRFWPIFAGSAVTLTPVDPAAHLAGLRPDWTLGVLEPSCA